MIRVEPVGEGHNTREFDAGRSELNQYLRLAARRPSSARFAPLYVLADPAQPSTVVGYYSLSYLTVLPVGDTSLQDRAALKINQFALSQSHPQRYGEILLVDAICKTARVHREAGPLIGLMAETRDEGRRALYRHYGFESIQPERPAGPFAWLPIRACLQVAEQVGR